MITLTAVKPRKVGLMLLGGFGCNTSDRLIRAHKPEDYPNFSIFVGNTDADTLRMYFGEGCHENVKTWDDAERLFVDQLGGEEIADGEGAGGDPKIGEKAAKTEKSLEAIQKFLAPLDHVIIAAGMAGGSGAGAALVVADEALRLKKSVEALAVMPPTHEERDEQAAMQLEKLQKKVPTTVYYNSYLDKYAKLVPAERRKILSVEQQWDLVNTHSIVPMIMGLREVLQVPGNGKNLDRADYRKNLSAGKHVHSVLVDISDTPDMSAGEVLELIKNSPFQNPAVALGGKSMLTWAHGDWSDPTHSDIRLGIKNWVTSGREERAVKLASHWGLVSNVADNKKWMLVIIVGDTPPEKPGDEVQGSLPKALISALAQEATIPTAPPTPQPRITPEPRVLIVPQVPNDKIAPVLPAEPTARQPVEEPKTRVVPIAAEAKPQGPQREIRFLDQQGRHQVLFVPADLAIEFKAVHGVHAASPDRAEAAYENIKKIHGVRPPARGTVSQAVPTRGLGARILNGWLRN